MKRNVMTDHRNRKHKDLREAVRRPHYPEWKAAEFEMHGVSDPFARRSDLTGNRG